MADPVVHLTNGVPDSGTGNITTLGQTLLDGANLTMGATTDAAVAAGAAGSLSAKLRAISASLGTLVTGTVLAAGSALIGIVKIGDGTNSAAIKAASTAPVAADPALVVSPSPNALQFGAGTTSATTQRVVLANDSVNPNVAVISGGTAAAGTAGSPVVQADQYSTHKEIAASQTAAVLGATGAIGDYLSHVTVFPGAAACGVVTILDGANTVGTFAGGGTTALPSLAPFMIPIGAFSTNGAWKITTGASVTVTGVGKFT